MNKIHRIKELTKILHATSVAYYKDDSPIMSDKQYDDLYDELESLEKETGFVLALSPTKKVQGYVIDGLKKVKHSKPMLSADKTKSIDEIKRIIGTNDFYGSFKLDGLTTVVRFNNGEFIQGITRGDGIFGEDVTEACKYVSNLPMKISYKGYLELRGECVISWEEFERINSELDEPYSHPRNLAAGTLRNLDMNIVRDRKLSFVVFESVTKLNQTDKYEDKDSKWDDLAYLDYLGFETVDRYWRSVEECIKYLSPTDYKYPVDGIIFELNSKSLSESLGKTSHHECCRIALKWADDLYETTLTNIEWQTSRTGLINPVAIFEPVDLGGAITTKATLHNISYIEDLQLGVGDTIQVYRANMVIPKVHINLTKSNTWKLPEKCPTCGGIVAVHNENGSKTLHCCNNSCQAKLLGKLVHAVSRNALNIDGLSEATLEKFVNLGWLTSIQDIYHLKDYADRISILNGFGERSTDNLLEAIEKSRNITLDRFLYALSIPLIGKSTSKDIAKASNYSLDSFRLIVDSEAEYAFVGLEGFGKEMNKSLITWWNTNKNDVYKLAKEFRFKIPLRSSNLVDLSGKTFVITGSLLHFSNRDEAKERIESLGGKVSGSVSAKTTYLVNNDLKSTSSKNQKAKLLGIPIINEEELLKILEGSQEE